MPVLRAVNAVVMFALEAAAYLAVGAAAWQRGDGGARGGSYAVLGVGVLILIWALWGAPKAVRPLSGWQRILLEVGWFGAAAAAIVVLGRPDRAMLLGAVWVINLLLRRIAGQLP